MKRAFAEIRETGTFTGLSAHECTYARQQIEDLVGLEQSYLIGNGREEALGQALGDTKLRDYEWPPLSRRCAGRKAGVLCPSGHAAGCLLADAPPKFPMRRCVGTTRRRFRQSGAQRRARGPRATAIFPLRLAWSCGAVIDLEPSMTDATFADPDGDLGLPGWVYSNPRFFAAKKERVLAPSWQVVCHLNDIPSAGDCHTFRFIGERLSWRCSRASSSCDWRAAGPALPR